MHIDRRAEIVGLTAVGGAALLLTPDANAAAYVEPAQENLASQGLSLELNREWPEWGQLEEESQACSFQTLVLGFGFVDNPGIPNRKGLIDPVDLIVGTPDFGVAVLNYRVDPKNPSSPKKEVARNNVVPKDGYAEVLFDFIKNPFPEPPNTAVGSVPAVQLELSFTKDKVRKADGSPVEESIVTRCGFKRAYTSGRIATEDAIDTAANSSSYQLRKVGTIVDQRTRAVLGGASGNAPAVDNPTENRAIFTAKIGEVKKDTAEVRAKEKGAPTPKPEPVAPPPPPPAPPKEEAPPPPKEEKPPEEEETTPRGKSIVPWDWIGNLEQDSTRGYIAAVLAATTAAAGLGIIASRRRP